MIMRSMSDRRALEKARRFTRDNISLAILNPPPAPSPSHIMAKSKAVFDKRVSLPCHVRRSGNMNDALANSANGRKIDKYHNGDEVA